MVLFFWSHNWYVRVWQSREEACIHQQLPHVCTMVVAAKKAQVVRRALTKSSSRQMFVVYCITSSKLTRHVSNKPQNSFKSLWLAKGILFFIQYRTYRNAARFDVPLILKRRNFLFKLFAFRALICLTELCKKQRP